MSIVALRFRHGTETSLTFAVAVNFRVAVEQDIPEMHRVRLSVRENVLRDASRVQPEYYLQKLNEHGNGWACEVAGRIVGIVIADFTRSSIWALFIEPTYEGRGVGRCLHETAFDWLFDSGATTVSLSTEPNSRAERFYRHANWRYAGQQPNGEARYEMIRERWLTTRSSRP
jgi:GNAT superfamily N-acetyltransferase